MKILSLGLSGAPDEIRSKLQQDCRSLVQEGFRIAIDETNRGRYTFFGCNIAEGELSFRNYERVKNLLKNCVAQILADIIIAREEKVILRKIVDHNYHYFGEQERTLIYQNSLDLLEQAGPGDNLSYASRRNKILTRVHEYFDTHHELVFEGFIAFRLKDYREALADIVDRAVDDYMLDLEYKEFVRVLRYFVDVQEAQVDEVHVLIGEEDSFKIRDSQGRTIQNQQLESFMLRNTDDINYEDLLISALITIAPRNVVLHIGNIVGSGIVSTIQNVFEGRVMVCQGCEVCAEGGMGQPLPEHDNS